MNTNEEQACGACGENASAHPIDGPNGVMKCGVYVEPSRELKKLRLAVKVAPKRPDPTPDQERARGRREAFAERIQEGYGAISDVRLETDTVVASVVFPRAMGQSLAALCSLKRPVQITVPLSGGEPRPVALPPDLRDAFHKVAAALFPEDVDHLMTNTPLGDAVDALVGRVKQLRLADQASADASMVIAERSKEIARALDVSESTTWKELVAQVVNRARLAQRLADGESARDALAVALGCEGTTWAELLSIAKGDDRGEANVQSKPCQRCDAGTLFKTLGTRGYPIWECSSCAHQENVAVGRAKPPGSRRPELEPGPTTISGSVGPYVDPELASLRAELAALGKHLEDVERRAYMSPTGEALAALEGRHMARIDDLTKRVEALVKRVEVSPPVWEVLSTRVAKIEGALDGWGPNEMLTSLAELRRGDWVVFDGAPREVVGLSPSEVVLGRGSADVYIDRTGPALQLVWRPGPRE